MRLSAAGLAFPPRMGIDSSGRPSEVMSKRAALTMRASRRASWTSSDGIAPVSRGPADAPAPVRLGGRAGNTSGKIRRMSSA